MYRLPDVENCLHRQISSEEVRLLKYFPPRVYAGKRRLSDNFPISRALAVCPKEVIFSLFRWAFSDLLYRASNFSSQIDATVPRDGKLDRYITCAVTRFCYFRYANNTIL